MTLILIMFLFCLFCLFWLQFHPDKGGILSARVRRRIIWRVRLLFRKWLSSREGNRVKRPKNISSGASQAIRLWAMAIHRESSLLLYNPVSGESYVEWVDEDCPVYLFLESGNLRIVNTVVGYDVPLQNDAELWCSQIFSREVNRRRTAFKATANNKVSHSLDLLEDKLRLSLLQESLRKSKPQI